MAKNETNVSGEVDKDLDLDNIDTFADAEDDSLISGTEEGADAGSSEEDTGESDEIKALRKQAKESSDKAEKYRAENEKLSGEKNKAINDQFAAIDQTILANEREADSKIESGKSEYADLKTKYKEALDSGENDKAADIIEQMQDKKIELKNWENRKLQIEDAKPKLKAAKEQAIKNAEQAETPQSNAPVLTDAAKKWVDAHPRFESDEEYRADAIGAHEAAIQRKIKVDSPEYFAFIDKRMEKMYGEEAVDEPKKPNKNAQSYSAPGNSGGGSQSSTVKKVGKLSSAEVEAAEMSGMTPTEYWDYKYGAKAPKKN